MPGRTPKLSDAKSNIWNERSPLVKMIGQRYERAGLHTWNNDRVSALAKGLNVTIWVLCAHAGYFRMVYDIKHDLFRLVIDRTNICRHWKDNHWPVWATLHFDRLERFLKTRKMEPGAVLLGVADGAAVKMMAQK